MKKQIVIAVLLVKFSCLFAQQENRAPQRYGFIENNGQLVNQHHLPNDDVDYVLPVSPGLNVQLRADGFSYDTYRSAGNADQFIFSRLDVEFVNANPGVKLIATDANADYINYYTTGLTGNEAFGTRHFQSVIYKDLYPGIDLVFYTSSEVPVKYDFVVHPGADMSQVQLKYTGFDEAALTTAGLEFMLLTGALNEQIPSSWWQETGEKTTVTYRTVSTDETSLVVGFSTPQNYQPVHTLVIDPEPQLHWATYYGDTLIDKGTAIMTDNDGYIYATGVTQSFTNLATSGVHQDTLAGGFFDAYVTKFQNNSVRIWSTYFGGSGWDESRSIMVDTLLFVTITGFTDSPDGIASDSAFQLLPGGGNDAFIAKFDNDGLRYWSTYLGGAGDETGNGIDTDFDGFIFVTGQTVNSGSGIATGGAFQPASNGLSDAFLVKMDTLGYPVWSTYFGGGADDIGLAVSEEAGSVFITGSTQSADLITTSGAHQATLAGTQDAFITAFSANGNLQWSTFFGGSAVESGNDIEIYHSKIYCVGTTTSTDQVADPGAISENLQGVQDAFITRWDTLGVKIWSTYYGKSGEETGVGVALELDGGLYVTGITNSDSMAMGNTFDSTYSALEDIYLARIEENGAAGWCTYYGSSGNDIVAGLDVYGNTSVYLTGYTNSTDSLAKGPCFQDTLAGNWDAFITRFTTYKSTIPSGVCYPMPVPVMCEGDTVWIALVGGDLGNGANWVWYENGCGPDGTQIHIGDTVMISPPAGYYTIFVRAESINNATECAFLTIEVLEKPVAEITMNDSICIGSTLFLEGSGGINYEWSGPFGFSSDQQNVSIDSIAHWHAGEYILTVDNGVCADTDTASLYVMPEPVVSFTSVDPTCAEGSDGSITVHAVGAAPFDYFWPASGITDSVNTNLPEGVYYVNLTDTNGCVYTDSAYVADPALFLDGFTTEPAFCISATGSATIMTTDVNAPYTYTWSNGDTLITADSLFAGMISVTVTSSIGCVETDSVLIDTINNLQLDAAIMQHETCVDFNDGVAACVVETGTAPFDFSWSSGHATAEADSLSPGVYVVFVTDDHGCESTDTVEILQAVPMQLDTALSDNPNCNFSNGSIEVFISGGVGPYQYVWTPTGNTQALITGLDSGTYAVVVTDQHGCEFNADFNLVQTGNFEIELYADDTLIYPGDSTLIQTSISGYSHFEYTYFWNPYPGCSSCTDIVVSPSSSQTYQFIVSNWMTGCTDTAEIFIQVLPCVDPFVPTIFSPNDDGLNDRWEILGPCLYGSFAQVYDRWGELIFESADPAYGWDGTFKNEPVPAGNYTYRVELELEDGSVITTSGVLTVMR